jgi:hypothetical protein
MSRFRQAQLLIHLCAIFTLVLFPARPASAAGLNPQPQLDDNLENYTYQLTQSTPAYQFWTTPPSVRVFKDAAVPSLSGGEVKVYAARNEFEPFQVVVKPAASGNLTVSAGNFGSGITAEIYQVKYVNITQLSDSLGRLGPYPDPLWPLANGATVAVNAGENTAFWFSIFVPTGTASGDYTTNVQIGGVNLPVRLHVFNFAIPDQLHVASQMNFSYETILEKYGVSGTGAEYWGYVDAIKQYFIDHRLTPSSVLWSGGLTAGGTFASPYINYNCTAHTFTDTDGIWGFESPAARYLNGTGLMSGTFATPFNGGVGFSTFMAASFAHNDPSPDQRPATFCGLTRTASDWLQNPTSAYNQAWFAYLTAMQNYLSAQGYLNQAYHYFANEPQDQADYDAVAWYSRYAHAAAPNLKLMVSEEPRPEIYDQTGAHIDIWLPVLNYFDPAVSQNREQNYGEESWIYFLHGTRPPYFNPITLDHPGIEGKLTGWFLWKYRLRGLAYYSLNDWSKNPWTDPMESNHNGDLFMLYPPSETNTPIVYGSNGHRFVPSIRFELMRDSLEDYEYLYVLSGGQPEPGVSNTADPQANKMITGVSSYTRHNEFNYNLRRLIGLKNGGEIATIPNINPPSTHPRAEGDPQNYYINFQDPTGQPTANPLVVNGKTYLKIGGSDYSETAGYGWYAPPDVHWKTDYLDSGPNVLQRSILYSDWGRTATFEFDLPNGLYNVTLSVGWQNRTYSSHKANIEGVSFFNVEATNPANPYIVRTKAVTITDNKLTLVMGNGTEYTMLNYLEIEAAQPVSTCTLADFDGDGKTDPAKFVAGTVWYIKSSTGTWEGKYIGSDGTYVRGSDFDGDGKTDPAKFVAGTVWYIKSSTGTWEGKYIGADGTYVPGSDFDGDGKTDPAKFVASTGTVWYLKSSTGTWEGKYLGSDGSYVSGSDFDGDGKSDPAKFVSSVGTVWYLQSSTGTWEGKYVGTDGTYVSGADFDGDGKSDPAKFVSGSGSVWYLKSSTGTWDGIYVGSDGMFVSSW